MVSFEQFALDVIELPTCSIRVRHGGKGFPILLLHGHPRTLTTWHKVAPILSRNFYVVCPDLPGFGASPIKLYQPNYGESSKRSKALMLCKVMDKLSIGQFAIVGHDRGGYVAYRAALDFPDRVKSLIIMEGVPLYEAFKRCDANFAKEWWHWFFFQQPEKPEAAILADPAKWYGDPGPFLVGTNLTDYLDAINSAETVRCMLNDYRAGASIDCHNDKTDYVNGRKITCPTHVIFTKNDVGRIYNDVLGIWRPWTCGPLSGEEIDSGHHIAEEYPEELADIIAHQFISLI